jgi:hypothetical protein
MIAVQPPAGSVAKMAASRPSAGGSPVVIDLHFEQCRIWSREVQAPIVTPICEPDIHPIVVLLARRKSAFCGNVVVVVASADVVAGLAIHHQNGVLRKGRRDAKEGQEESSLEGIFQTLRLYSRVARQPIIMISAHRQQEFLPAPNASVVAPLVPSRRSLAGATIHEPDKGVAREPPTCDELRPGAPRFQR